VLQTILPNLCKDRSKKVVDLFLYCLVNDLGGFGEAEFEAGDGEY